MKFPAVCFPLCIAAFALVVSFSPISSRGQDLYVTNYYGNTVSAFNAQTAQGVPGFTPPGSLRNPSGIAISGSDLYVIGSGNSGGGVIREYDLNTGAQNTDFTSPTNLNEAEGLAASGNALYVANYTNGTVTAYSASDGSALPGFTDPSINGSEPAGIAVSGTDLFVAGYGSRTIYEYNALTGHLINSETLSFAPYGLAVSGTDLFVSNYNGGTIDKYDTLDLAAIPYNAPTGLNGPAGLAILGNDLFVANFGGNSVGEYDATTGSAIAGFEYPAGLSGPDFIAVAVPEPDETILCGGGILLLAGVRRIIRKKPLV